jgi:hypothetical protein
VKPCDIITPATQKLLEEMSPHNKAVAGAITIADTEDTTLDHISFLLAEHIQNGETS